MITAAVVIGCLVLLALTIFQIALISGKPYGEYAWGGRHKVLPRNLRIGSVSSIVLYVLFGYLLLAGAGIVPTGLSESVITIGLAAVTGYAFLGVIINGISTSEKERKIMIPVSFVLFVAFLVVTLPRL